MPYSRTSELPDSIKNALPAKAQEVFMVAVNRYLEQGMEEDKAFKAAWGAVKNAGWSKEGDKWVKKEYWDMFEVPRAIEVLEKENRAKKHEPSGRIYDIEKTNATKSLAGSVVYDIEQSGSLVAFVGASPGSVDVVRGTPFSGTTRETLKECYIEPLGLDINDVALYNVAPVYLVDDAGRVREPTEKECEEWKESLFKSLEEIKPLVVVALGLTAKNVLGDKADAWAPHPIAIRRFGNTKEAARKCRAIKAMIEERSKAIEREEVIKEEFEELETDIRVDILKTDEEKHLVCGAVLVPGIVDAQGDIVTEEEIEKAAHKFMQNHGVIGDRHRKQMDAFVAESFISPVGFNLTGDPDDEIIKGTWIIVSKINNEDKWNAIKRGEYTGFSIGGYGHRKKINE